MRKFGGRTFFNTPETNGALTYCHTRRAVLHCTCAVLWMLAEHALREYPVVYCLQEVAASVHLRTRNSLPTIHHKLAFYLYGITPSAPPVLLLNHQRPPRSSCAFSLPCSPWFRPPVSSSRPVSEWNIPASERVLGGLAVIIRTRHPSHANLTTRAVIYFMNESGACIVSSVNGSSFN